jgi:hypothetical protein
MNDRRETTMLSRVADSLYWMSRYLERAEHTARLIDVDLQLRLDQSPDAGSGRWLGLLKPCKYRLRKTALSMPRPSRIFSRWTAPILPRLFPASPPRARICVRSASSAVPKCGSNSIASSCK